MPPSQVSGVALRGVVCSVPGEPLDAIRLGYSFGEDEASRIASAVGLNRLHRSMRGQTAADLCGEAAKCLLRDLSWEKESLDAILMVTQTPDHFSPCSAAILHGRLGLSSMCAAFDVNLGCSGFVYGMWLASLMISSGNCRRCLVLVGDTLSQLISPSDQGTAMIFGDAGSATALEADGSQERWSFVTGSDGRGWDKLIVPGGAFRERNAVRAETCGIGENQSETGAVLHMDGFDVFAFTMKRVPALIQDTLELQGWHRDVPDAFLFHQANKLITVSLTRKLGLPSEKVPSNIERYGNTSGCSIPLLMADDLSSQMKSSTVTKLVLAGFGIGYSWAGAAITTSTVVSAHVIQV